MIVDAQCPIHLEVVRILALLEGAAACWLVISLLFFFFFVDCMYLKVVLLSLHW